MNDEHYVITTRFVARPARPVQDTPCWLVDAESHQLVSRHPSLHSAVLEAKRIAAYRSARKLDAQALVILPAGGVRQ